MPAPRTLCLLLATSALLLAPTAAFGREQYPYLDVAGGVGVGMLDTDLAGGTDAVLVGFPLKLEARLFAPTHHGLGLGVTYVEEPSLFDGPTPRALFADAVYAFRGAPERDFHVVPALFVGPSYLHYEAIEDPELVGPVVRDHHALGGVAGLSLDLHGEVLFGGLELSGRYALPIADETDLSDWGWAAVLRLGFTLRRLGADPDTSPRLRLDQAAAR